MPSRVTKCFPAMGCGWRTSAAAWGTGCSNLPSGALRATNWPALIWTKTGSNPPVESCLPPRLHLGDARRLPWPAARFDVVSQFTVFTSILDPAVKRAVASEMLRVLKPGGVVLWYDFRYNNPRNPMVKGIEADEIRALFPDCRVDLERVTLAPPVARAVVPLSFIAALLLQKIPFLRTHYLGIIQKNIG